MAIVGSLIDLANLIPFFPMTKRRNGAGWNADLAIGQKTAFTMSETKQLSDWFARQERWHDLSLLSVALDSFLRAEDLLSLRVRDVTYSDGSLRESIGRKQRKTKRAVHPELTTETQANLRIWTEASGKQPQHYLFNSDVDPGRTTLQVRSNSGAFAKAPWALRSSWAWYDLVLQLPLIEVSVFQVLH